MLRLTDLKPLGLDPVSLTVDDGACLAVTGPSGSGKTLFLRAIADLDENGGEAETSAKKRSLTPGPDWRRSVVYVPAESGWWGDTVSQHVAESDHCRSLLINVGLDPDCLNWPIARLSTGEKQRLALVRALLLTPDVLLLDEATSALDGDATAAVEQMLKRVLDVGTTLIMVSHDAEQATRFNARLATVRDGIVVVTEKQST